MGVLGGFILGTNELGDEGTVDRWQDIQLSHVDAWNQLKTLWANGNYAQAINVLQNGALTYRWIDANKINIITNELVRLQNQQDPDFKKGIPVTSPYAPSNPTVNSIWFEVN